MIDKYFLPQPKNKTMKVDGYKTKLTEIKPVVTLKAKKQLKSKTKLKAKTPIKKVSKKKSKIKRPKVELCIMPHDTFYKTKRENGLVRHEVFFGRKQRDLSIKYGLVIFIKSEEHEGNTKAIHQDIKLDEKIKQIAQREFVKVYPELNFREIFGKNYL